MRYKIGLDVSGGDFAPEEILKGAILAKEEFNADVILIGVREEIEKELSRYKSTSGKFVIMDAPEKIGMGESPVSSVRRKRNSSIVIGVNFLKARGIDAFVSCGNTGAVVCASTLTLGLIEGIERSGIAVTIPTQKGVSLMIDVGANISPKPLHLLHYGIMASIYCNIVLNKENPTIGLLNIGEEASKGSDFIKYVHKLFSASALNFIGNLEAKDIFSGKCDCIVCDGFVGNVALKVSEGCAEVVGRFFIDTMKKSLLGKIGLLLAKGNLKKFKNLINYAEYGGAPLLGVNGIVIIGHGRSSSLAVKNAIRAALQELNRNLNLEIKKRTEEICQEAGVKEILAV
ncbi:MAG: phosphate acyltransferase PlsX [Candidatus Omnitrophica bacterium]|nr:phosphate acyltransferase PlsX [Candidatus Omnitrophota bacterium]MBU0878649.1 phosphate acyltransferase PlsX [Candidatus Omnitrophota bacterium]MBU0896264.1 phosphate acyltransferase PlsX [Candidatus Omnitrophota bacterium]MBU1134185.1 phosphate acyltransferase PlsX [Candidatus Omnitrophota bacterium]MBU1366388.1 phosphate acyltransferase PlsX [Candidatus Omnitrophota bacterium]